MSKQTDPVPARAAAYCALYPRLLQIARDNGYSLAAMASNPPAVCSAVVSSM